ncbi:DNA damage-inducible protein 1 [Gonapodya sp. JEL0774]|nr:DNA damage-inducible protein 1 [Gonapodya sp. JEL0774]
MVRISLTTEAGDVSSVEVDLSTELEILKAIVEAELSIPATSQVIVHNGRELKDDKMTLQQHGVTADDILLVVRARNQRPVVPAVGAPPTGNQPSEAEIVRQQILADPQMLRNLSQRDPELASTLADPTTFATLFASRVSARKAEELRRQREFDALASADPFDIEAQRKIEEAIRAERVQENMELAMEHNPEAFGRVVMLYVDVEVNGKPVKAFVDSGAQATIISPECAEACGIMRLVDKRFAGVAMGVGTAKIIGRVHSAPFKVGKKFFTCSFTVMEGKGVDLLFGLDMLKRHQAVIDLRANVLRIYDEEVPFLAEHELPAKARLEATGEMDVDVDTKGKEPAAQGGPTPALAVPPARPTVAGPSNPSPSPAPTAFSGTGNRLGAAPNPVPHATTASTPVPAPALPARPSPPLPARPPFSEENISTLMALGASRDEALQALQAAGGNVDVAGALLFQ